MRSILFSLAIIFGLAIKARSQPEAYKYSNFPITITLQFHALSMPFHNVRSNFQNVGFGIGTELSYNGRASFTQQFQAVWYRNRAVGNGIMLITQPSWRPTIYKDFFGEIKAGAGYLYSFRPVESFRQVNGEWISAGHRGKGMLTIPVGISLGYNSVLQDVGVSPFLSYQFMVMTGYNKSLPIVPQSFFQVGSRIHIK